MHELPTREVDGSRRIAMVRYASSFLIGCFGLICGYVVSIGAVFLGGVAGSSTTFVAAMIATASLRNHYWRAFAASFTFVSALVAVYIGMLALA